jgi:hypothetical protein
MRNNASTYAPRAQRAIEKEREQQYRLTADRIARQRRAEDALAETSMDVIALYREEKERAERQGKPTLLRIDEFRGWSA